MNTYQITLLEQAGINTPENRLMIANRISSLRYALDNLSQKQLLNQDNLTLLMTYEDLHDLDFAVNMLFRYNLLTQDNFAFLANSSSPSERSSALYYLNQAGILTTEMKAIIAKHELPSDLAQGLARLTQANLLTDYHRLLSANPNPRQLAEGLIELKRANLIDIHHETIAASKYPYQLSRILSVLNSKDLLAANLDQVKSYENSSQLCEAVQELDRSGILTPTNFSAVISHPDCMSIARLMSFLGEISPPQLTDENRARIAAHPNPYYLSNCMTTLKDCMLLQAENFVKLMDTANLEYLFTVMNELSRPRDEPLILNQDIFDQVVNHPDLLGLSIATMNLQNSQILNQDRFERLLAHPRLINAEAITLVWDRLPYNGLTETEFDNLLIAAENTANPDALRHAVNHILGEEHGAGVGAGVVAEIANPAQSTHTASVHQSVSQSAKKLMELYGEEIADPEKLSQKLQEIQSFIHLLPSLSQNNAAKRYINRIIASPPYFIDETSGVSLQQLLTLAYIAIHDEKNRLDSSAEGLESALEFFINGLYEIQRGYNLNAAGKDKGGEDKPICTSGSFNKIIEKLNGVHREVNLRYVTVTGASDKLRHLAVKHAMDYLHGLASPDNLEGYLKVVELFETLEQEESIEPIWEIIHQRVAQELWDEYADAFNALDGQFESLVENAKYIRIPAFQMAELREKAEHSLGKNAYSRNLLWASRHSSPTAQKQFDEALGVAVYQPAKK